MKHLLYLVKNIGFALPKNILFKIIKYAGLQFHGGLELLEGLNPYLSIDIACSVGNEILIRNLCPLIIYTFNRNSMLFSFKYNHSVIELQLKLGICITPKCKFYAYKKKDAYLISLIIPDSYCLEGACKGGHYNLFLKLIKSGITVERSAFIETCKGGNLRILRFLIKNYFNHEFLEPCFKAACYSGKLNIVKFLIRKFNISTETKYEAFVKGQLNIIKYFINLGYNDFDLYMGSSLIYPNNIHTVEFLLAQNHDYDNDSIKANIYNRASYDLAYVLIKSGIHLDENDFKKKKTYLKIKKFI